MIASCLYYAAWGALIGFAIGRATFYLSAYVLGENAMIEKQEVGRLALRVEGNWWVAYYAKPNTMDGAIEMGRIAMAIVESVTRKEMFKAVMMDAIDDLLGGRVESWDERPAPESERSERA